MHLNTCGCLELHSCKCSLCYLTKTVCSYLWLPIAPELLMIYIYLTKNAYEYLWLPVAAEL